MKNKAQATVFIIIGLLVSVAIVFYLLFTNIDNDTSAEEVLKIENIDDATTAIENCIAERVETSFYLMGLQGGYLNLPETYSTEFMTVYDLLDTEEMETNLRTYLEKDVINCKELLATTEFGWLYNSPSATVVFSDRVDITINNLGKVEVEDMQGSLSSQEFRFEVNLPEIHAIAEEKLEGEQGISTKSHEGYQIYRIVRDSYDEALINIVDNSTRFEFNIARKIE